MSLDMDKDLWEQALTICKDIQQEYYELLPDWNKYEEEDLDLLSRYIGCALGDFNDENHGREMVSLIYDQIMNYGKEPDGSIFCGVIYNIIHEIPKKDEQISERNIISIPIFKIKNYDRASLYDDSAKIYNIQYIDNNGRLYRDWNDYLTCNKLFECIMVVPKNGYYEADDKFPITEESSKVLVAVHLSPACSKSAEIMNYVDKTFACLNIGALGITVLSLVTPLGPVILLAGSTATISSGIWMFGRSIQNLIDRTLHRESVSITNRQALPSWLGIAGTMMGAVMNQGSGVIARAAQAGERVGLATRVAYNTVVVGNISVNLVGIGFNGYCIAEKYREGRKVEMIDVLSFITHAALFGNTVLNTQFAHDIIDSSHGKVLQEYEATLRSKRHRKAYNKVKRKAETKAEIVRYVRKVQSRAELLSSTSGSGPNGGQPSVAQSSGGQKSDNSQPNGARSSGGERSDGQPSGARSSGGERSDSQRNDNKQKINKPSSNKSSDSQSLDSQSNGNKPNINKPSSNKSSGGSQANDVQPSGSQRNDNKPSGARSSGGRQSDNSQPNGARSSGGEKSVSQSNGNKQKINKPSSNKSSGGGSQASDGQRNGNKPSGARSSGGQPNDSQSNGDKPSDSQPSDSRPSDNQSGGSKSNVNKPNINKASSNKSRSDKTIDESKSVNKTNNEKKSSAKTNDWKQSVCKTNDEIKSDSGINLDIINNITKILFAEDKIYIANSIILNPIAFINNLKELYGSSEFGHSLSRSINSVIPLSARFLKLLADYYGYHPLVSSLKAIPEFRMLLSEMQSIDNAEELLVKVSILAIRMLTRYLESCNVSVPNEADLFKIAYFLWRYGMAHANGKLQEQDREEMRSIINSVFDIISDKFEILIATFLRALSVYCNDFVRQQFLINSY